MTSDDITQGTEACLNGSAVKDEAVDSKSEASTKGRAADSTVNQLLAQENLAQWSTGSHDLSDTLDVLVFVDRLLSGGAVTPLEMRVSAILLLEQESNLQLLKAAIKATRLDTADGWCKVNERAGRDMGNFALINLLDSPDVIVVEKALIIRVLFSRLFPR